MTTIITAKFMRIADFSGSLRDEYRIKKNPFRGQIGETVEDIMGYCLDAPDEIPAGGIVDRSAGVFGNYPFETVSR